MTLLSKKKKCHNSKAINDICESIYQVIKEKH